MAATQTKTINQPIIPIAVNNDLSPPRAKTNLKVVFGAMTLGTEGITLLPPNVSRINILKPNLRR
jgi:hypothetical protein